jgi:Fe-Mn family superoxide dismutase
MNYTLQSLPYEISALEPVIDTKTMDIHFNRHHKTYVDNLKKAVTTELIKLDILAQ